MIEGHHTIMGTCEAMTKRIQKLLPDDPECRRLFDKWKREFRVIASSGREPRLSEMKEVSATYYELKMNLELEGIAVDSPP